MRAYDSDMPRPESNGSIVSNLCDQARSIIADLESNHFIAAKGLAHLAKRERQLKSLAPHSQQGSPSIAIVGLQAALAELHAETDQIVVLALESFARGLRQLRTTATDCGATFDDASAAAELDAAIANLREATTQALPEPLREPWMAATEKIILETALSPEKPSHCASKSRL